ncbi:MAG: hypothetical protein ACRBFS_07345 [Aureispira sp.]
MIEQVVLGFRDFLKVAWPAFLKQLEQIPVSKQEDCIDDWLQVNWELLVETAICEPLQYLWPYGSGGNANGISDRILFSEGVITHAVVCYPKVGEHFFNAFDNQLVRADLCIWEKFASLSTNKQHYIDGPPFDYVLLSREYNELIIVAVKDVVFKLETVEL